MVILALWFSEWANEESTTLRTGRNLLIDVQKKTHTREVIQSFRKRPKCLIKDEDKPRKGYLETNAFDDC